MGVRKMAALRHCLCLAAFASRADANANAETETETEMLLATVWTSGYGQDF